MGFDLLGLANVAANLQASKTKDKEPQTYKALVKRDIFDPLNLSSNFFDNPTPEQSRRIVVPAEDSYVAVSLTPSLFPETP